MNQRSVKWAFAGLVLGLAIAVVETTAQGLVTERVVSAGEFRSLMSTLSNWGRWGSDDQLGTLNLITPAVRQAAAKQVREGVAVSLSRPIETTKELNDPQRARLRMLATGTTENVTAHTDELTIAPHGAVFTHFDAPAHFFWNGAMYNGVARSTVGEAGAPRLGVETAAAGVFTRGVLIDVARCKGVPQLTPATPITDADLDACLRSEHVTLRSGDVVLVRTGRAPGPPDKRAGLHVSAAGLLKRSDIAVAGTDSSIDAWPSGVEGVRSPIHVLLLVAMGTPILDHLELDGLSRLAAEKNRWEFLLSLAPLRVVGATGSAINPTAIF